MDIHQSNIVECESNEGTFEGTEKFVVSSNGKLSPGSNKDPHIHLNQLETDRKTVNNGN